ncbi:MAG: FAD-dependent oxidoreductase, partial [Pirellulales bacterium]
MHASEVRKSPILILGAGINGAALARELVLAGMPVVVVDTGDLARGATSCSSRLIHGGLRYLEYGEFDLVRESLAERTRLLRLAPQFVRPLKLFIPVSNRCGGLWESALRFFELRRTAGETSPHRGLWLVRAGLKLYDWYARDPTLPRHAVLSANSPLAPPVDRGRYPWLCAYYDAQVRYPERFVVALFEDARRLAEEQKLDFQLLTYHRTSLDGSTVSVEALPDGGAACT